jgi:hypothetical protein
LFTNELMYGGTIASCGGEEYPVVIETEKLGLKMGWNAQYGAVEWKEGGEDAASKGRREGRVNLLVAVNGQRIVPGEDGGGQSAILSFVKGTSRMPRPVRLLFSSVSEEGEWKCPSGTANGGGGKKEL